MLLPTHFRIFHPLLAFAPVHRLISYPCQIISLACQFVYFVEAEYG